MSKEKWVESLLDDMIDSQWNEDVIKEEYERFKKIIESEDPNLLKDLEPKNQYSQEEIEDMEAQEKELYSQIENLSKKEYEDYLIEQAVDDIQEYEFFKEFDYDDEYYEKLIRQHLEEEENDFFDNVMKEAIAEADYFQEYVDQYLIDNIPEDHDFPDEYDFEEFEGNYYDFESDPNLCIYSPEGSSQYQRVSLEKDEYDDLGDTSYMDQGIYKGANTDFLEEPFEYTYYEEVFIDDDYPDFDDDFDEPFDDRDDLSLQEPFDEIDYLISQKLFEEKQIDEIFVKNIKKCEEYWDKIIKEKLASDEKYMAKLKSLL